MRFFDWIRKKNGDREHGMVRYGGAPGAFIGAIALVVIVVVLLSLISSSAFGLSIGNCTQYLEGQGYWVLAAGECYPEDFIPCEDNAQELGRADKRWSKGWFGDGSVVIGSVELSNTVQQLDIDGQLVMHDAGKVWLEIQPSLNYTNIADNGKPTQVFRGVHPGFSLPLYNDDDEELFVSADVPREWDGITSPIAHVHAYIPNSGDGFFVSPDSFIDSGGWEDEVLAYDADKKTFSFASVAGTSWSNFLEFGIDSNSYDGVRFYAKYDVDNVNSVDIDAFYDAAWNDVYQGAYESMAWVDKPFDAAHTVAKYRVRFYNAGLNPKDARLYETSLCRVSGQGNFNLEIGWGYYSGLNNDLVLDTFLTVSGETLTTLGEYVSYQIDMTLDSASELTVCDQVSLRLRRIEASESEIEEEVVITHIGIQFLRDKLGTVTPNGP